MTQRFANVPVGRGGIGWIKGGGGSKKLHKMTRSGGSCFINFHFVLHAPQHSRPTRVAYRTWPVSPILPHKTNSICLNHVVERKGSCFMLVWHFVALQHITPYPKNIPASTATGCLYACGLVSAPICTSINQITFSRHWSREHGPSSKFAKWKAHLQLRFTDWAPIAISLQNKAYQEVSKICYCCLNAIVLCDFARIAVRNPKQKRRYSMELRDNIATLMPALTPLDACTIYQLDANGNALNFYVRCRIRDV